MVEDYLVAGARGEADAADFGRELAVSFEFNFEPGRPKGLAIQVGIHELAVKKIDVESMALAALDGCESFVGRSGRPSHCDRISDSMGVSARTFPMRWI